MNYITLRNREEKQLRLYVDFIPYCETHEEKLKLIDEIQRLRRKITHIDNIPNSFAHDQVMTYSRTFESNG